MGTSAAKTDFTWEATDKAAALREQGLGKAESKANVGASR